MASERSTLIVPGPHGDREVGLSSPNRVVFPEVGITKHELAEYLVEVSAPFLAANGDRQPVATLNVTIAAPLDEVERFDHPWVREYFHGPRARAAQAARHALQEET